MILLDSRRANSGGLSSLKDNLNKLAKSLRGELTPKICDEIIKRISAWCILELPLLHYKDFTEKVRSEIDEWVTDETLHLAISYLHYMGEVHHAKLRSRDAIIIVHPNWLTTTIFAPIFAPPDFRADYSGLPLYQEYTIEHLRCYFKLNDLNLLVDLLEYFELAYRNDDGTFVIPAKLPEDTPAVVWSGESKRYFGRRIACRNECDMFSIDMFPCLQVSMMNRYRQENVKPLLSRFGVKVLGEVEGMAQLTRDKRAIHIAVRVNADSEIRKGREQLQEMESLLFDQIDERSKGTDVSTSYLSPRDLKMSTNLEDDVSCYSKKAMKEALTKHVDLGHPVTLTRESTFDVNPSQQEISDNYAKVCEAVHAICYLSLPTVQSSVEAWHQRKQRQGRPCLNSIHCLPHKKPTPKSRACQPCVDWGKEVDSACFPVGKEVQWRNVTASLFHKDPVEVAKAFLFKIPPGQILTTFGDFDVGGVLKLMMGFKEFHNGDQACYDKIGKVLDIRNRLSHMKVEDNMAITDEQLEDSFDAIEDVVTSLKRHQPTLKDDKILSKLKQIRVSRVTQAMMERATDALPDSLMQALDEWLDKNKKGIAEGVWEDPTAQKLEQDVTEIKGDIKKLLAGAQKSC